MLRVLKMKCCKACPEHPLKHTPKNFQTSSKHHTNIIQNPPNIHNTSYKPHLNIFRKSPKHNNIMPISYPYHAYIMNASCQYKAYIKRTPCLSHAYISSRSNPLERLQRKPLGGHTEVSRTSYQVHNPQT